MRFFSNVRIGARLGGGFAGVLFLAACAIAIEILRLDALASATPAMMTKPIAKERIASDWYRSTLASIRRTSAIVKSAEDSLGTFFADDMAAATKSAPERQKAFEPLLATLEVHAIDDKVAAVRKKYVTARDVAVKLKAEGKSEASGKVLTEKIYLFRSSMKRGCGNCCRCNEKILTQTPKKSPVWRARA